jgi:hypothetical protein
MPPTFATDRPTTAVLEVRSDAFAQGGRIPVAYTCEGADLSPPLSWSPGPDGTRSYALLVDDPDAPPPPRWTATRRFTWLHWTVWDLTTTRLDAGALAKRGEADADPALRSARQGRTDFGRNGWGGPCPPRGHGDHRYHFRVYALDRLLGLPDGATRAQLETAMAGHVLAQGLLVGVACRD